MKTGGAVVAVLGRTAELMTCLVEQETLGDEEAGEDNEQEVWEEEEKQEEEEEKDWNEGGNEEVEWISADQTSAC